MKLQNLLYNALQEAKDPMDECGGCERDGIDYTHGHDHEASMADAELKDLISNASKLQNIIKPGDQLPGWVSAYITLASDYMHSVSEYMQQQQSEMGADGQAIAMATPGFAIYEDQMGEAESLPVEYFKDPKHANFFIAKINYSKGAGGVLTALGSKTASGQQRDKNAVIALRQGNEIKNKLEAKLGDELWDVTVEDLGSGKVTVFAVSDYFSNLTPLQYKKLINS